MSFLTITNPDFLPIAHQCWDKLSTKAMQVEDELQINPHTLNRHFFETLNEILRPTNYTYLVGRDLKIAIYKP